MAAADQVHDQQQQQQQQQRERQMDEALRQQQLHQAQQREAYLQQRQRMPQWKYLAPLAWAPLLQATRLVFRDKPHIRNPVFFAGLTGMFLHGTYVILFEGDL